MKRNSTLSYRLLAFCALGALCETGSATNLLVNPDFDNGFTGWTVTGSVSFDSVGDPTSGSAVLNRSSNNPPSITQCVDTIAVPMSLKFRYLIDQRGGYDVIGITVHTYDQSSCNGTLLDTWHNGFTLYPQAPTLDWQQASFNLQPLAANTQSMSLSFCFGVDFASDCFNENALMAHVDHAELQSREVIFSSGFDGP